MWFHNCIKIALELSLDVKYISSRMQSTPLIVIGTQTLLCVHDL